MKRFLSLILAVSMSLTVLAGCTNRSSSDDRLKIVVTVFPIYDWVRNIMGDDMADADVTLLMNSGTDMHSFQPTAANMVSMANINACKAPLSVR